VFAEIDRSPRFARRLIAGLSTRVEALVRQAERQDLGSGRARVVDYLLRQAGDRPAEPFTLPASKAAVAAHLHLTAEHFSRLLRELVDEGKVRMEGRRITLLEPERLRAPSRQAG
jgi:CRP-like cAMP-binding protein